MTIIFSESFETDGNGTRYITSTPEFSDGIGDFFTRTDGSNVGSFYEVSGQDGGFYFAGMDLDGEGAEGSQTLTLNDIDITGFENLSLSLLVAEDDDGSNQDWDADSQLLIEVSIDDGAFQSLLDFQATGGTNTEPALDTDGDGLGDGPVLTPTFANFSSTISGTGSSMDVRISFNNLEAGDEDAAIDNIVIEGDTVAESAFTLHLLHFTDQEANAATIDNIDNLSGVLNALRDEDIGADATLTLSSGDAIIPGLFFAASETVFGSEGIADIQIQNELGVQAIALGNHEFDRGTGLLAGLIDGSATGDFSALSGTALDGQDFTGTAFPYLSTNLDFSAEPNLGPLAVAGGGAPLPNTVTSSVVIEEAGEQIGIVGATVPTIGSISSPGDDLGIFPTDFDSTPTDEQLDALAAEIQFEVDALLSDNPDMNKVILLSHMQQISIELALAERLDGVDIIVAGGSNTRLFDDNDRARDGDSDQGEYPLFVTNAGGTTTAVVNTDGNYKYVGRLAIDFDDQGNIIADSYDETVSGAFATDDRGLVEVALADLGSFEMSEAQEVGTAVPDTTATGSVTVDAFDAATGEVTISGTFSGLTDANAANALNPVGGIDSAGNPESAIHLHNAAAGANGPIVRNFTVTDNGDGSGSFTGTFTLTPGELAELVAGNTYVNLHTTDFGGGQLRGQVDIPAGLEASGLIDPEVDAITDAIQAEIVATESNVFGVSDVFLNGNRSGTFTADDPDGVRTQETNLGNLTSDANLIYANQMIAEHALGDPAVLSIKNGGGIRAKIGEIVVPAGGTEAVRVPNSAVVDENGNVVKPEGGISQNDIGTVLAFNNGLALVDITRTELIALLEGGVSALPGVDGGFPQVSGVRFSFDQSQPEGSQIQNAGIYDESTGALIEELVRDGAMVGDGSDAFRLVTLNFLLDFGDPILDQLNNLSNPNRVDLYDLDGDGNDDGALSGAATFAEDGTEQDALAEYLNDNFNPDNGGTAFDTADVGPAEDERIQNLAFREDTVLPDEPTPVGLTATVFAEFDPESGEGGSEVVAHEAGLLYVTNGAEGRIDIFDLSAIPGGTGPVPMSIQGSELPVASIDLNGLDGFGGVQSVAVANGVVAVAMGRDNLPFFGGTTEITQPGFVALFDAETLELLSRFDVGNEPDQLTFSPDGQQLLIAIEGQANGEDSHADDPAGAVVVVDVADPQQPVVNMIDFEQLDGLEEIARDAGIRLAEGIDFSRDVEPEYIAISPDGTRAYVTLQENNAVAILGVRAIEEGTGAPLPEVMSESLTCCFDMVIDVVSLGTVDHSIVPLDANDRDDGINIETYANLVGMRMPDAITAFEVDGETYFATANEGDGRGDPTDDLDDVPNPQRADEARLGDIIAGEVVLNGNTITVDESVDTTGLERLTVSLIDGDTDGDGDIDVLHAFGSRSFSIFDRDGNLVFDSGSDFSDIIAREAPDSFQDGRSDNKGPEPEAIITGTIDDQLFAFIGLERNSGIMVYNITDPANAVFVEFIEPSFAGTDEEGDPVHVSPEVIAFIPAEESVTGNAQIAVSYEVSGTTVVYDLTPGGSANQVPDAVDDELILLAPGNALVNLLDNDSDPDGDTLSIISASDGITVGGGDAFLTTDGGREVVMAVAPDGTALLLPFGAFGLEPGATDSVSFSYQISDGNGGTDDATVTVNIEGAPEPKPTIMDIQGAGHLSTFAGQEVTTCGIVTAVAFNGFYMQDAVGDGDDATSDGIFVFTGGAPGVSVGDEIDVTGTVSEFIPGGAGTGNLSITQITSPTIETISTGNALPMATLIGQAGRQASDTIVISVDEEPVNLQTDTAITFDPEEDAIDFWESLEGMLVTIDDPVAVSGTRTFNAFSSENFFVADGGANASGRGGGLNDRGGIDINAGIDGTGDLNPERIQVQYDPTVSGGAAVPEFNVGDAAEDITGVVGYSFGNFEVIATDAVTPVSGGLTQEVTTLQGGAGTLSVATYNVLNLDPNDSDGSADIANGQFDKIASQIVNNLNAPDIIALQEIQDNSGSVDDGTTDADVTLQTLVDAISAAGGPNYAFASADVVDGGNGGQPGGNIRNAYLYNADRVDAVSFWTLTPDYLSGLSGLSDVNAFAGTRDPFLGVFEFEGEQFRIINNHFSSRSGSTPIFGGPQPFEQAGEAAREAQATLLNEVLDLYKSVGISAMVMGDLNTFEFTDELSEDLAGTGTDQVLTNLIDIIAEDDAYSFIFDGNSQALDHIFVTDDLLTGAAADYVHVNVDFARDDNGINFASTLNASDHDPIVATFDFGTPPVAMQPRVVAAPAKAEIAVNVDHGMGTDEADMFEARNGKDLMMGFGGDDHMMGGRGADTLDGGDGDDTLDGGNRADVIMGGNGNDLILGGNGRDDLSGDAGNDSIEGGNGRDRIEGGTGDDTMDGGSAGDTFVFDGAFGTDTILNFQGQSDMLEFQGGVTLDDLTITTGADGVLVEIATVGTMGSVLLDSATALDTDQLIFG